MSLDLKIDQLLHGYKGGHRRLAGSLEISKQAEDVVSRMSDRLPSNFSEKDGSYLCGYPLLSARKYVFARTWSAPELPRPGCVWTHSLLLDYQALVALDDPTRLLSYFIRPNSEPNNYDVPLYVQRDTLDLDLEEPDFRASSILSMLYVEKASNIVIKRERPRFDETLVLALWRQMWPRLRRGFAFCTFVSRSEIPVEAEVTLLISDSRSRSSMSVEGVSGLSKQGVTALAFDLPQRGSTGLRLFLANYVVDMPDQKGAALLLAQIYTTLESGGFEYSFRDLLLELRKLLPAADDGLHFKEDFFTGQLLFGQDMDPTRIVEFVSAFADADNFIPKDDLRRRISEIFQQDSSAGTKMVSACVDAPHNSFGESLLLSAFDEIPTIWNWLPSDEHELRERLLRINSKFVQLPGFWPRSESARDRVLQSCLQAGIPLSDVAAGYLLNASKYETRRFLRQFSGSETVSVFMEAFRNTEIDPAARSATMEGIAEQSDFLEKLIDESSSSDAIDAIEFLAERILKDRKARHPNWRVASSLIQKFHDFDFFENPNTAFLVFEAAQRAPISESVKFYRASFDSIHNAALNLALPEHLLRCLKELEISDEYSYRENVPRRLRLILINRFTSSFRINPLLLSATDSLETLRQLLLEFSGSLHSRILLRELAYELSWGASVSSSKLDLVNQIVDDFNR
jgi:hypothetical protein